MNPKTFPKICLLLIIILACFLRFYNLSSIPNGFSDDEAAFGYNAYSILKTGTDEWGKLLPITSFKSFGDYKLPVYFYLTSASILIFGLTEFAVRFPTAIFGVFSVIATFFLVKKIFDEKVALLAAFLLAISPFHIFVSRHALESAVPIFFNLTAAVFFIRSFKEKKMIIPSMILFAINLYVYRSTWIFVPFYLLALLVLFKDELAKNIKNLVLAIVIFAVLATPIAITAFTARGTSRLRQIGITSQFNMIGLVNDVNYIKETCSNELPKYICTLTHNKYLALVAKYTANYTSHYSPQLLFISGSPDGEQMVKGRGFLYFFQLPFIIVGIIFMGKNRKSVQSRIILPWLLIYPLASASTGFETPGRQAIAMPVWEIITATGVFCVLDYLKQWKNWVFKASFIFCFTVILIFQFGKFVVDYFYIYPQTSGKYFRYGYNNLFSYLKTQENNYDKIVISNKLDASHQYIFLLFYSKVDPKQYQGQAYSDRHFNEQGWVEVERIGKYYFHTSKPGLEGQPPKTLFAVGEKEMQTDAEPMYKIDFPNRERAFEIYDADKLRGN